MTFIQWFVLAYVAVVIVGGILYFPGVGPLNNDKSHYRRFAANRWTK